MIYLVIQGFFRILIHPIPFFPYPGIMARLTLLFNCPVVLALMDLFRLGVRIPNFIESSPPQNSDAMYMTATNAAVPAAYTKADISSV